MHVLCKEWREPVSTNKTAHQGRAGGWSCLNSLISKDILNQAHCVISQAELVCDCNVQKY